MALIRSKRKQDASFFRFVTSASFIKLVTCFIGSVFYHMNPPDALDESLSLPVASLRDSLSIPLTKPVNATKSIPNFDRGGLMFFLHIPKTGGSTIRLTLEEQKDTIEYGFVAGRGKWNRSAPIIDRYLSFRPLKKRKILILEVHGRDSPHLLELMPRLRQWKAMAKRHHIPTFFFTILRDPIPYSLSYFNFFYVQRKNPNFEMVAPTEANFNRLALWDPQNQFLARGEYSLRMNVKQMPTRDEMDQVKSGLLEVMDWVGTTEKMSTETLPLLSKILNLKSVTFESQMVTKKDPSSSISLKQLSDSTVQTIQEMSNLDTELYRTMAEHFDIRMWKDVDGSSSTI